MKVTWPGTKVPPLWCSARGEAFDHREQAVHVVGLQVAADAGTHQTTRVGQAQLAHDLDRVVVAVPHGDALGGQRLRHLGGACGRPR